MVQGRRNTDTRGVKQVNVRVPLEVGDVLDAAAFVRDLRGLQELVAPELERFANQLQHDPEVAAALRARQRGRTRAT